MSITKQLFHKYESPCRDDGSGTYGKTFFLNGTDAKGQALYVCAYLLECVHLYC